jgi:LAO/AO transport system kinase
MTTPISTPSSHLTGNLAGTALAPLSQANQDIASRLLDGERRSLARAITLVESTRTDDRAQAQALLARIMPATGKAIRLGLSGAPGVGKSTFIESFGQHLTAKDLKVAVLAIDPSSSRSGGSILGDKTRMNELARDPKAFIRPSPAGRTLGGVARRTREAMLLCEAAGFDLVLIETVGVGQSETTAAEMVDMFILLLSPAGGDDLQGIKRGIMELADLLVVTKADGDLARPAMLAKADHQSALHLMRPKTPHWNASVVLTSSFEESGMEDVWLQVEAFEEVMKTQGELAKLRQVQAKAWMWNEIQEGLMDALRNDEIVIEHTDDIEAQVVAGTLPPTAAARHLLRLFTKGK